MDVRMFGPVGNMTVPRMAQAVRQASVGADIRIITDVAAVVQETKAFAHLSKNAIHTIEQTHIQIVDMVETDEARFQAATGPAHNAGPCWVIVLRVLPTNTHITRSE